MEKNYANHLLLRKTYLRTMAFSLTAFLLACASSHAQSTGPLIMTVDKTFIPLLEGKSGAFTFTVTNPTSQSATFPDSGNVDRPPIALRGFYPSPPDPDGNNNDEAYNPTIPGATNQFAGGATLRPNESKTFVVNFDTRDLEGPFDDDVTKWGLDVRLGYYYPAITDINHLPPFIPDTVLTVFVQVGDREFPPPVPEPGVTAFVAALGVTGTGFLIRRRRASRL